MFKNGLNFKQRIVMLCFKVKLNTLMIYINCLFKLNLAKKKIEFSIWFDRFLPILLIPLPIKINNNILSINNKSNEPNYNIFIFFLPIFIKILTSLDTNLLFMHIWIWIYYRKQTKNSIAINVPTKNNQGINIVVVIYQGPCTELPPCLSQPGAISENPARSSYVVPTETWLGTNNKFILSPGYTNGPSLISSLAIGPDRFIFT